MPLQAFEEMPLTTRAKHLGKFTNRMVLSRKVVVPEQIVEYPLKAESDRANLDLFGGGVQEHRRRQDALIDPGAPPP